MNAKTKIVIACAVVVVIAVAAYMFVPGSAPKPLEILYPYDGTLYPPEIAPTEFVWKDNLSDAGSWRIRVEFEDGAPAVTGWSDTTAWVPGPKEWETIKTHSKGKKATIVVRGVKTPLMGLLHGRAVSEARTSITVSSDSVGAPIFYRDVPLPFNFAKEKMELIQWRLGDISNPERPPVAIENLPVCGNCHTFSRDGSTLAMDVDSGGDKGAYAITPFEEQTFLSKDRLITWNDFRREQGAISFGLLAQISPDGRFVASTVEDRVIFLGKEGTKLEFSQLFFPVKGIVAYYDRAAKTIKALPGASDPDYCQSNPSWSPDGKYIIFAKAPLRGDIKKDKTKNIVLTLAQSAQFLGGEQYIEDSMNAAVYAYDLYRLPFNEGRGGTPEPVPGASGDGKSNYFAKYSPDGKWIVFCKARSFMLLQPDSRLWIMPADFSAAPRELKYQTKRMNSWHSWSPNSKWIVFSSKEHSPYTELFLTHIDEKGENSPPVRLSHFSTKDRARNIPEFVNIRPGAPRKVYESFVDYYSYMRKAEKLEEFKKFQEAEEAYKTSIKMNPDFAETRRKYAYMLTHLNRLEEAEKEFGIALKLTPKDPLSHQNLGEIYLAKQDYDKALAEFQSCLKADPNYSPAHLGVAQIMLAKGDRKKARASLETTVKLDPDNFDAQLYLGMVAMETGEYDRAEKALKIAQRGAKYDADPEIESRLGTIYLYKKDFAAAEKAFQRSLALEPSNPGAYNNLGVIYLNRNDITRAEQMFRSAYKLSPDNPGICMMLAQVLSRSEQSLSEAISLYRRAIELSPSNYQLYVELGNAYLRAKERQNALQAYEQALRLNPSSRDLKDRIAGLRSGR